MRGKLIAGYRLAFGLLTLGTFGFYLATRTGDAGFSVADYLSFFTIQSNVIGGVVLVWGAVGVLRGRAESPGFSSLRGAAAAYLITTGVIFQALLADVAADLDTPGYVNVVMHQVLPIVMLLDWLFAPPANTLGVKAAATWLLYPLAYAAYSLVRGPLVAWYPYPFLDPRGDGGYGHVAVMSCGIAAFLVLLAAALVWVGNRLTNRARPSERPLPTSPGR